MLCVCVCVSVCECVIYTRLCILGGLSIHLSPSHSLVQSLLPWQRRRRGNAVGVPKIVFSLPHPTPHRRAHICAHTDTHTHTPLLHLSCTYTNWQAVAIVCVCEFVWVCVCLCVSSTACSCWQAKAYRHTSREKWDEGKQDRRSAAAQKTRSCKNSSIVYLCHYGEIIAFTHSLFHGFPLLVSFLSNR